MKIQKHIESNNMKFIHLSVKPFLKFKKPRNLGEDVKPNGVLWVANENAWKEFMELDDSYREYEVDVDMSKVIKLETYEDIASFNEKYGLEFMFGRKKSYIVDWDKVRKDGSGIYIKNPDIKRARKDFVWYSTFDVECIGIWNSDAINSVKSLS